MRTYTLNSGDTLHLIARKKYYVYNDQGDEDIERITTIVREIVKRNPCVFELFDFPKGKPILIDSRQIKGLYDCPLKPDVKVGQSEQRLLLPKISGIPAYDADKSSELGQWWLYAALWFAGIVVGMEFYLARQYLIQQPNGYRTRDLLDLGNLGSWLGTQLLNYIVAPDVFVSTILSSVVIWSLAVWAVWLCFLPAVSSPVIHLRIRYLVGWISGLIVLIPGLYLLLNIVVPLAAPMLSQFADLLPLLVIWSILMFLLYLYLGDGSDLHREYLVPYQSIWTVFILLLMFTILAGYSGYQEVGQRIQGDLSTLTMAQVSGQHLHGSTHSLVNAVTDITQKKTDSQEDYIQ